MGTTERGWLDDVLNRVRGFMEARVLLTAAELDVFTVLGGRASSARELAEERGWDPAATEVLLDALTAMGCLTKRQGRYANTPEAKLWLSADSPETALPYLLHLAGLWKAWSGLTDKVGPLPPDAPAHDRTAAFIGAMHVLGRGKAHRTIAALRPLESTRLLDVGGASGTYTIAFLRANPDAEATLFDLPDVVPLARRRLAEEGLSHRVRIVAGDLHQDALPGGHDLALLSAIIHMNSPEENLALFRKCREALEPGGRVVIRDHLMSDDRTSPRAGALFAVNMLAATAGGRTYSLRELSELLREAGFEEPSVLEANGTMDDLIEARKPN
ncbi:MAG: methyltransferase [Fimbriimonadaceae bacterium]